MCHLRTMILGEETWFTSDLHIGHANIIKFCQRPFGSVEEMNDVIVARINDIVPPDWVLIILGDAVMGKISETLGVLASIKAEVKLVPGNHDRCWTGNGDSAAKWVERYKQEGGVSEVLDGFVRSEVFGEPVAMCHFPPNGDSQEEERFVEHRPSEDGWLLHGHTHGAWRQNGRMIDVGLDSWGGRPVSIREISDLMLKGPGHSEKLAWS